MNHLFDSLNFIPHGHCYLWIPQLVALHVVSDALIGAAYLSIPFALVYFVRRRTDLAFPGVFLLFGLFILSCGLSHMMSVWTVWNPDYWLAGAIKAVTAVASVGTAFVLWPLIPKALALPRPADLRAANERLLHEIEEHRRTQALLEQANADLEARVAARTQELEAANARLQREIAQSNATAAALEDSEARLRATFSQAAVGIARADFSGRLLEVNEKLCEMTGYSAEDLLQRNFLEITHADDVPRNRAQIEQLLQGAVPNFSLEKRYLRADGKPLWVAVTVSPVRNAAGIPQYLTAIVKDISARKEAQEELRRTSARLSLLLANTPLAVIEWQADFTVTNWAGAAEQFFEWKTDEVLGRSLDAPDLLFQTPGTARDIVNALRGGSTHCVTTRVANRTRGGRSLLCDWYTSVARNERGETESILSLVLDVTEREHAALALRDADRRKDEFLATLAHELRNPLAPISNAVNVLRMENLGETQIGWARDIIDRQVAHLAQLLDDLLDVSRISRSNLPLRRAEVPLEEVVNGAIETSRPLIDLHGHALSVSLPSRRVTLDADALRLSQIMSNLLSNAAKYTERGGYIDLIVEQKGADLVIRVRDNGVGLDPEHRERIFEMFSQATPALDRSQGGLGIGLSLVRGLVQLHGGTVEAHSEGIGRGSEFVVRLPGIVIGEERVPLRPRARQLSSGLLSGQRVLVADDNRDAADSLTMLLHALGASVATAYDGQQAVDAAFEFQPDVIFLDIGMPRMNGYEAAQALRASALKPQPRLVALTGWGQEEDRRKAAQAGFDLHLVKPVNLDALTSAFEKLQQG